MGGSGDHCQSSSLRGQRLAEIRREGFEWAATGSRRADLNLIVWAADVRGEQGKAGLSVNKRAAPTASLLTRRSRCSWGERERGLMERLLALIVFPAIHRREALCMFHRESKLVASLVWKESTSSSTTSEKNLGAASVAVVTPPPYLPTSESQEKVEECHHAMCILNSRIVGCGSSSVAPPRSIS